MTRLVLVALVAVFAIVAAGSPGPSPAVAGAFFVVNHAGDAPDTNLADNLCQTVLPGCTLRAAIEQANANGDATDVISFSNGVSGTPLNIRPASPLPAITEGVTIAGQNANGASCEETRVLLVSIEPATSVVGAGLRVQSPNVIIQGLSIGGFTGPGILFDGDVSLSQVSCSNIGVAIDGVTARPNQTGIAVSGTTQNIVIGGTGTLSNIVSGNGLAGIAISDSTLVTLRANHIGVDKNGAALPNDGPGVLIHNSTSVTLGSSTAGNGNIISGNASSGVYIEAVNGNTQSITFRNNRIGYAPMGESTVPNGSHGIVATASGTGTLNVVNIGEATVNTNRIFAAGSNHAVLAREETAGATVRRVKILQGDVISESGLAINLRPFGESVGVVTPNDGDDSDADTGPNTLLNFPNLVAVYEDQFPDIFLTYRSSPSLDVTFDFYQAPSCNPGNRSLLRWLGSTQMILPADGIFTGQTGISSDIAIGDAIVAVARDNQGNTSEIGNCVLVEPPPAEIDGITPRELIAGQSGQQVVVEIINGTVDEDTVARLDGVELATSVLGPTSLEVFIPASVIGTTARTATLELEGLATAPYRIVRSSSDVNCSGDATSLDAVLLLNVLAGLLEIPDLGQDCENPMFPPGDANRDTQVGLADALHIRTEVADLIEPLPFSLGRF